MIYNENWKLHMQQNPRRHGYGMKRLWKKVLLIGLTLVVLLSVVIMVSMVVQSRFNARAEAFIYALLEHHDVVVAVHNMDCEVMIGEYFTSFAKEVLPRDIGTITVRFELAGNLNLVPGLEPTERVIRVYLNNRSFLYL